ncbi:MAG: inositol monophosphatase [Tepidisphaeraceae bacterium]
MSSLNDLKTVETIARGAGDVILKHFRKVQRLTKTHAATSNEAVTEADRESQRFIVAELRKHFPATDGVIGEESDDGSSITLDVRDPAGRNWVIDPIDGTNNFIAGLGGFCVCIGLLEAGVPTLGVVYDVLAGKVYRAARGVGAFVNDQVIACPAGGMHDASVLCMTANLVGKDGRTPGWAVKLLGQLTWKVRILGSAALEAVLVAEGVAGAAIQVNTKLWDIAAAAAIVLEAGGTITDLSGNTLFPFDLRNYAGQKIPYLAGTHDSHGDVLEYLKANP